MSKLLEIQQLKKSFGGVQATDNFNLSLERGAIYGLIGPNGAGKTTIFNLITGIYLPDSGRMEFCGQDLIAKKPHEIANAGIGRTFQNIRLFSQMTVLENVIIASHEQAKYNFVQAIFHGKNYQKYNQQVRDRAFQLLHHVGLEDQADEKASSLPYGHQRRLEIARALALNPELLLLDEPAAGMNATESAELVDFIQQIKEEFDLTILLIEHHMDVVSNLCDHVTVLNFGKTICEGPADTVRQDQRVIDAYLGGDA